jgi:hypothetical protein
VVCRKRFFNSLRFLRPVKPCPRLRVFWVAMVIPSPFIIEYLSMGEEFLLTKDRESVWRCKRQFMPLIVRGGCRLSNIVAHKIWFPSISTMSSAVCCFICSPISKGNLCHPKFLPFLGLILVSWTKTPTYKLHVMSPSGSPVQVANHRTCFVGDSRRD